MLPWFSRLFSRAAAPRRKSTIPLVALHGPGGGFLPVRQGAGLVAAGYHRNAIVYRCVRLVAEAAASVSWTLLIDGREAPDHPLGRLLERPNPGASGTELFEALYGHLLLSGNGYVARIAGHAGPLALHALRPDRLSLVPGPDGWPLAYDYAAGGATLRFPAGPEGAGDLLHLRLFDPLNDQLGFAPLAAAETALAMHEAAHRWNNALLDNSARPSGALVYAASDSMTETQFDRLRDELESAFQGAGNAGRPILLEGGLDWKPLSLSPRDMDFHAAQAGAAREIALAFGVPPMLLGLPGDNTYANYAEANRALLRLTVLPMVQRMQAAFAHWLQPPEGGILRFRPDLDAIEALAEEREALWRRVSAAPFLSEDEKREALGYGRQARTAGPASPASPPASP